MNSAATVQGHDKKVLHASASQSWQDRMRVCKAKTGSVLKHQSKKVPGKE